MKTWKNIIRITCILPIFILVSCDVDNKSEDSQSSIGINEYENAENAENAWYAGKTAIQGKTQGTTFIVKTSEDTLLTTPNEISNLLMLFDSQLSGYIPSSVLSKFNAYNKEEALDISVHPEFQLCYELSQDVYKRTNGAFDPSVFPLVKAWGFFKEMNTPPTASEIDSILTFTSFENNKHHSLKNGVLKKLDPRFELDFNAIAQGLSVDYLADFLDEKGHNDYFIEIGGEIRAKGVNNERKPWIVGIDQPTDENDGSNERKLENYLSLNNVSVATSGNYRKFYEKDGKRYSHTLNPKKGYPVEHNLLSATVISQSAAIADAYATAFMTMGVNSTMDFIKNNPDLNIEVYLLFENEEGRIERAYSDDFKQYFL
jgi:thiamine biosynthesis lipoprotein